MNRKNVVISSVSLGLLLSAITLAVITWDKGGGKLSVSFVSAEASTGPPFSTAICERLAFAVQNDGTKPVPFVISEIRDEHGKWFPSFKILDEAAAGQTTHLYVYLPQGSHPQAVRLLGYKKASIVEKAQCALRMLRYNSVGQSVQQVWFPELTVQAYEFVVKVETEAAQKGLSQ